MFEKYLHNDPIPWLLEKNDPVVRYLTLRDILQDGSHEKEFSSLEGADGIKKILAREKNGVLGDRKRYDLYHSGMMWYFAEAVERGLDGRHAVVRETASAIVERSQMPSGGFTLNWKPMVETACRTGDMVRFLIASRVEDEAVRKGIAWIESHQRHDGGWLHCPLAGFCDAMKLALFKRSGSGLKREGNSDVTSCIYATIACSMALAMYPRSNREITGGAAEYFLKRKMYQDRSGKPIKPKASWNPDFRLLGYPLLSQYDVLHGLLFIARAGYFHDPRTGEAFNMIMTRQNSDGTWNCENDRTGMLVSGRTKECGSRNKWVTLNVLRLLKTVNL
ncbi:MAG: hypothetical protein CVV44_00445 [Spirochaetae bacterium HGW-Spirochaetae-1]|jgi:hypothetical protein|nr:MAG: hypothetical protein CVV44_00445 [Spirochaetae bacterium HGW-Spirochaetae-1]